jgi:hypothetical protein
MNDRVSKNAQENGESKAAILDLVTDNCNYLCLY